MLKNHQLNIDCALILHIIFWRLYESYELEKDRNIEEEQAENEQQTKRDINALV